MCARLVAMGITISHGAFVGSYTGFDELRTLVFRLAGYGDLNEVEGFTEPVDPDDPDGETQPDKNLRHLVPKSDPVYWLVDVEDTEGAIRNAVLPPLAERIRGIIHDNPDVMAEQVPRDPELGAVIWQPETDYTWGELLSAFADGCERAHAARADLTWD